MTIAYEIEIAYHHNIDIHPYQTCITSFNSNGAPYWLTAWDLGFSFVLTNVWFMSQIESVIYTNSTESTNQYKLNKKNPLLLPQATEVFELCVCVRLCV